MYCTLCFITTLAPDHMTLCLADVLRKLNWLSPLSKTIVNEVFVWCLVVTALSWLAFIFASDCGLSCNESFLHLEFEIMGTHTFLYLMQSTVNQSKPFATAAAAGLASIYI